MPACKYCEESFDDEAAYHAHLADEHAGELSRIDRRRIEGVSADDEEGFPTGPAVLVGVIGFSLVLVVYVVFFLNTSGTSTVNGIQVAQTPTDVQSTHLHGPINVTIDGRELDFSRAEFQRPREYPAFHFEGGDGQLWHGHAEGITLEYAMATLGIDISEDSLTYDGETYRDDAPDTTVRVEVNGQPVDPVSYELSGPANPQNAAEEGDFVHIVVTRDSQ